jgi:ATP-dependent Lon protease
MKNVIISNNTDIKNNKTGNMKLNENIKDSSKKLSKQLYDMIYYFQNLIQKTILSIQSYKKSNIIGTNDLNSANDTLETLYTELSNNLLLLKSKPNLDNIKTKLDTIRTDLGNVFKQYGTDNICDLLNIIFGDEFLGSVKWDNEKFILIESYFHPVSFKIISWESSNPRIKSSTVTIQNNTENIQTIEKNKIVDDSLIVEKSENLDCFDLSRSSKIFPTKVFGIKIAIHNYKDKNTIIISGMMDDLLISCIDNNYLNNKIENIVLSTINNEEYESNVFQRYIQSLTLKEIIVYSNTELLHKYIGYVSQLKLIKQKPISQVVKEFLNNELYGQRSTLIQLLLKSDEHEYQYLAYLLYDLLSPDIESTSINLDTNEQTLLFDSLPWKTKRFFKEAMKQTISYTNNLSNFDNNKIPLEQQICLMKTNDSVKEKAMNKLKEIKSKGDDSCTKARSYLDGLLKIPFGIYKQEPILNETDNIRELFKNVVSSLNKLDKLSNYIDNDNITKLTNIQIKNICIKIKNKYSQSSDNTLIDKIINEYCYDKRNELIINICSINNIIKKHKLKKHKLSHSGKKIECMQNQIKIFIQEYKDHNKIICELVEFKKIINFNLIHNMLNDISAIEHKWSIINNYMNNITNILTDAVHGHDKAKRQIQRIIAQWINGESQGYCFGFEGPPGTGKTTFAKKGLSKCLLDDDNVPRPFSFIAIGGQDNGSSLNGHNYTYVGSEWGKFVDILIKNKCMNPIIFIDELDKISKTENGKEIIGILTHLVDSTQNDSFQDKYFNGIDLDLSKALFIFSYNDVSAIDKILLDRIHRIKFEHLTIEDKLIVTNKHILPEIYTNMGLNGCIKLTDENILYIIENYTNEPGIRKFKELLFEIIGEINLQCLTNYTNYELPICITNDDIKYNYLKHHHIHLIKSIPNNPSIGIINGLWANSMGQGGIIPIESQYFHSNIFLDLKLTGLQGDVMKESMAVAKTLASSLVSAEIMKKNIQLFDETKMQGIHIHCPEGSVPKDGPSAGTAITCSLYSLLSGKVIKNTIAITGEINLQGCITAIGGLELKILGGIKGGVKEFIFPKENLKDFQDFQEKYKIKNNEGESNINDIQNLLHDIQFHSVEHIQEVLKLIFV